MSAHDFDFLDDTTEQTSTRFVCFITDSMNRFDLAITRTDRYYGKRLVTDLQSGKTAIVGPDDLKEEGYLEHAYGLDETGAKELKSFLEEILGPVTFSDY
ncbi:MAG TPA: DUF3055 domain-containing protein [Bacilli bacterium]